MIIAMIVRYTVLKNVLPSFLRALPCPAHRKRKYRILSVGVAREAPEAICLPWQESH